MTPEDFQRAQAELGLSDGRMATVLGITRQSWRNWRTGRETKRGGQRPLVELAIRALLELRRLDPENPTLPDAIRGKPGSAGRSGSGGDSNDRAAPPWQAENQAAPRLPAET